MCKSWFKYLSDMRASHIIIIIIIVMYTHTCVVCAHENIRRRTRTLWRFGCDIKSMLVILYIFCVIFRFLCVADTWSHKRGSQRSCAAPLQSCFCFFCLRHNLFFVFIPMSVRWRRHSWTHTINQWVGFIYLSPICDPNEWWNTE